MIFTPHFSVKRHAGFGNLRKKAIHEDAILSSIYSRIWLKTSIDSLNFPLYKNHGKPLVLSHKWVQIVFPC